VKQIDGFDLMQKAHPPYDYPVEAGTGTAMTNKNTKIYFFFHQVQIAGFRLFFI